MSSRRPAIDVALFEQGRVAQRQAGRGTGIVVHEPEPFFYKLAKQHGVRDARHIYQGARRGSLEYLAALKRLRIECGLQIRDALHFSTTPDGIQELEKEYGALRDAGLEVAALKGAPFSAGRDERLRPYHTRQRQRRSIQGHIGIGESGSRARAKLFEQSPVMRVRPLRRTVEIKTEGGMVTASKVVIASGYPTDDFKPLRRRFIRCDSYVVLTPELPAGVRREMTPSDLILRDTASPDHWMHWVGNRVFFSGADQPACPAARRSGRSCSEPGS